MLITSAAVPLSAIQVAEVKSCEIIVSSIEGVLCATLSTGLLSVLPTLIVARWLWEPYYLPLYYSLLLNPWL
jgi:hypothetical protein